MSDNETPTPSRNPFIKFKQHVDSRINTAFSSVTGARKSPETAPTRRAPPSSELPPLNNASTATEALKSSPQPSPTDLTMSSREAWNAQATRKYWTDWAESSPYSPYSLSHLEPPVPAGVAPGDAHMFGFEDAFEDLMAATQGKPLMDLRKEANFRRAFYKTAPFGEPPMLWVDRLTRMGLLSAPSLADSVDAVDWVRPAPQESEVLKALGAAQQERLAALRRQKPAESPSDVVLSPEEVSRQVKDFTQRMLKEVDQNLAGDLAAIVRQAEELLKAVEGEFEQGKILQQLQQASLTFLKELDAASKAVPKALNEFDFEKFVEDLENSTKPSQGSPSLGKEDQQKPQPDTEEEHLWSVFGALMDANAAGKKPAASATDKFPHVADTQAQQQWPSHYAQPAGECVDEHERVEDNQYGGQTRRWTRVYASPIAGMTVEETEVQVLDAESNVVSHEKKVAIRTVGGDDGTHRGTQHTTKRAWHDAQMQATLMEEQQHKKLIEARREREESTAEITKVPEAKKPTGGWFWR